MAKIRTILVGRLNLIEFTARRLAGRSTAPDAVGYEEFDTATKRSKRVRSVSFGALGVALPPVVARNGMDRKDPSERPAKHPAGFAERYLARPIRRLT